MRQIASARTRTRSTLGPAAAVLVVVTASIVGTLVYQPPSSSAPSFIDVHRGHYRAGTTDHDGVVTEDDGPLPDGVTVFDERYPGVANLDPDLLRALREATTQAAADGIESDINSGWHSPDYQHQLLREAISEYGSKAEAARWVATANTSPHASGNAVDIGGVDAATWLAEHGAEDGLCRIYGNEPWHFELRPAAIDRGCPPTYADPTQDPRMQT